MNEDCAILLADVSGSTPLYERFGDEKASKMVFECVEEMQQIAERRSGEFVRSKGDDVLCLFKDADSALVTAKEILDMGEIGIVSVHAGLHWGSVVRRGDELFGGALNVAARLSSRAKENEVLMSSHFADKISPEQNVDLRPMGEITLRGTVVPTEIYAMLATVDDGTTKMISQTQIFKLQEEFAKSGASISLVCGEWERKVNEGYEVTIGRSNTCDLVLPEAWISRIHASISVHGGLVEFTDRSAAGCTLNFGDQSGYFIRRQTVALTGSGTIELGGTTMGTALPKIDFTVAKGA